MTIAIKVPSVGESITEGTIARWLKKDGQRVEADEPLFELETDKATTAVPAPAAGVLHIEVAEGQTVKIGAVIGQIDPAGKPAAEPTRPDRDRKAPVPAAAPAPATPEPSRKPVESAPRREVVASPAARVLAEEKGIDTQEVPATGRGGRVTKEDVVNYLDRQQPPAPPVPTPEAKQPAAPPPSPPAARKETRRRMTAIRQRIAERLVASQQTTATLTTFNEADMSAVTALRNRYKDRFKDKHGVGLGFMSFFVKACVEALHAFPVVNARIDGAEIVEPAACHIGVAVSTDKGLLVPVLKDADRMSLAEIERAVAALAVKARNAKITPDDLQGGTFTITNGGVFGSLLSTPILNPPQSAILGMHAIQKRPVVIDDAVVVRPMMYLALSYDHRLIDGREAVLFLVRVKECIEDPQRLLLEI
ncbi:MAG TPA: 2-oxoglutarate dehydrogenase complex dihydrolipoyllysine-residue succinyltransferase [Gemmataceae bacterium]|nr:2-oxoglutarate dehydrogenase complex dihydrolipoyllysine-residue succinyltransferase [Gemmataceae bacterium]